MEGIFILDGAKGVRLFVNRIYYRNRLFERMNTVNRPKTNLLNI